jgi:hypothetical protein
VISGKKSFSQAAAFTVVLAVSLALGTAAFADGGPKNTIVWGTPSYEWFHAAAGTEDDPYVISTAEDLSGLAQIVDGSVDGSVAGAAEIDAFYRKYVVLANDIDLKNEEWNPIGYMDSLGRYKSFNGVFDGRGHTIRGIYITKEEMNDSALFGMLQVGPVKNLRIQGSVTNTNANGAAGFTGWLHGTIENCVADMTLLRDGRGPLSDGRAYVAPIASIIDGGRIRNCITYGTATATGESFSYAGGIVGMNSYSRGKVENCVSNVSSLVSNMNAAGIMASNLSNGEIYDCVATTASYKGSLIAGGSLIGAQGSNVYWLKESGNLSQPAGAGGKPKISDLPVMAAAPFAPEEVGVGRKISLAPDLQPRGGSKSGLTYKWESEDPDVVGVLSATKETASIVGVSEGVVPVNLTISGRKWVGSGSITITCWVTVRNGGPGDELGDDTDDDDDTDDGGDGGDERGIAVTEPSFRDGDLPADILPVKAEAESPSGIARVLNLASLPAGYLTHDGNQVFMDSQASEAAAKGVWGVAAAEVIPLPVVSASASASAEGGVFARGFDLDGASLMAGAAKDVRVMAIRKGGAGAKFEYAASSGDYGDGRFAVLKNGGNHAGAIDPDETYTLVLFVKDGGDYDLSAAPGVLHAAVIVRTDTGGGGKQPGGGGGGCSTVSPLALLVAAAFLATKGRARKK